MGVSESVLDKVFERIDRNRDDLLEALRALVGIWGHILICDLFCGMWA
ncbi:MAG: hypothetical protein JRJ35_15160 [Deltaproteobacteria bacterium]|nr:hypothetical protein [Deltaproteobacteria bacterium]MBW2009631.1 hypothetical protein [Deltaproteobacteria bacterium]